MSNLVIVESPAKASTIKSYLGSGYRVVASKGHVCDLPKSRLGVDIENDFEPKYINIRGKGDLIKELKKEAKASKTVYLATDPDREGEAISWHLATVLGLDEKKAKRISFNEITKPAVKAAIAAPRQINMDLVNSQQARRILDRIVGYQISPLLWRKVKNGISAGRVQSVATKLVVERENEIRAFQKVEYWTIEAHLLAGGSKAFKAKFYGGPNGRMDIHNADEAEALYQALAGADYTVSGVKKSVKTKNPAPPFTTSQLQQEAFKKLNFQSQRTMRIAQELYEGINLGKKGDHGLITYMRTDSLRISDQARDAAKEFIVNRYGADFYPSSPRVYKTKGTAQDAHEAIRPTDMSLPPEIVKPNLSSDQYRLYKLIWDRFIASQMTSAVFDTVSAEISADTAEGARYIFKASGETMKFAGYTAVYEATKDDDKAEEDDAKNARLPVLTEGAQLKLDSLEREQKFTQPPSRYTEATLTKALEEMGIGRPSTYTPTLTTILARGYIERKAKQLVPTSLGEVTTDLMQNNFGTIMDYGFTANLERELDNVADGKEDYKELLRSFYSGFKVLLDAADKNIEKSDIDLKEEELDIVCDKCGSKMVVKHGRFGKFAACPNYPECKNTMRIDRNGNVIAKEEDKPVEGMVCELCGGPVVIKHGRFGDFYACANYPTCRYTKQIAKETGVNCPKCGGKILVKRGKQRVFYGCENYPDCDFSTWDMPTNKKCPECGALLLVKKGKQKLYCSNKGCKYTEDYTEQ